MKYIPRQLEKTLKKAVQTFPAVLVTGPRQSGKTTLLRHSFNRADFVSLEEPDIRQWAIDDPRDFLETRKTPLILDEIQYAPGLLPYIKNRIDENRKPGQWFMTGSQQFTVMKNVSESLAGRIAITHLLPLSRTEINRRLFKDWNAWFASLIKSSPGYDAKAMLGDAILRGSYPETVANTTVDKKLWYDSYISTYIERDLKTMYDIGNLNTFYKFIVMLAARTGQILNLSALANDLGVSVPTVKRWVSVLEASFIIYLLQPYYANVGKRLIKSPKIYFIDTGLASHLTGITGTEALLRGPLAGQFFETFIVSEFIKSFYHSGERPPLYFLNNKNLWEIDLIIDRDLKLFPAEIKLSATITDLHLKNFSKLRDIISNIHQHNYIIANQKEYIFRQNTHIIPWSRL